MKIIKSKFILIAICSFFIFQSCDKKIKSEELSSEQIQLIKNSNEFKSLSTSEKEIVLMDLQTTEEKESFLKQNKENQKQKNAEGFASYNTRCSIDGRICCKNCTSNGDPNRCAKTRFRKCSVCGHSKGSHRAQRR